ncbi:transposase [Roseibacillus ishigakijimensis]|uniref:transposase n=1 Tax=Roseibacillus ishigakijimensis TaxID=454146 RepID=UPI0027DDBF23|nr:transposase [Roseibacillus ishigakijimensis]
MAYYHCVSRVVNRDFVLGEDEKAQFYRLMRLYEKLYHLRVVSYCIMSNHFHVLVEVPQRPAEEDLPDDAGLISHVFNCLGEGPAANLRWELEHYRSQGNDQAAEELREKWFSRMWNLSAYMKILKQRFTQWFNRVHQRRGTLWEDRFKSVLVEGKGPALKAMAAYIDLNPVRAGICQDPAEYRWCSYGEAVGGSRIARRALAWLDSWVVGSTGEPRPRRDSEKSPSIRESLRRYRCYLFGVPESEIRQEEELAHEEGGGRAQIFRDRISREKALEVLASGVRLEAADYLRCRVRYFLDGVALGSKSFLAELFEATRDEHFAPSRQTGPRSLKGLATVPKPQRLYNFRQLGKDALG